MWHTYGVDSVEEKIFVEQIDEFSANNPDIVVHAVRTPFLQNLQQFINAAQAGTMRWMLDLERMHGVTGRINRIEAMATRFQTGRAAMVIDGPWNWDRHQQLGIETGQALLPAYAGTGQRLAPMIGFFGWSVTNKPEAVRLAQWLAVLPVDRQGRALSLTEAIRARTEVPDQRTPSPDTRPVSFTLGSIALSVTVLLAYLHRRDIKAGNATSRHAYFHMAPALIGLTTLTFHPIAFGIWLSFTNADQSRLGEEAWVSLANFFAISPSPGIVHVTLAVARGKTTAISLNHPSAMLLKE